MPSNTGLEYGSCKLQPAVCAIVESVLCNSDEDLINGLDAFLPLTKEMDKSESPERFNLKFLLVDVEAFVKPVAVTPDIGGAPDSYFSLKDRSEWKQDFEAWLREPHYLDEMVDSDNEFGSSSEEDGGLTDDEEESDSGSEVDECA